MTGYRPFLVVLMPSRADGIMDWDGVGVLEGWRRTLIAGIGF